MKAKVLERLSFYIAATRVQPIKAHDLYVDGAGELASHCKPAEYTWAGTQLVWGKVA